MQDPFPSLLTAEILIWSYKHSPPQPVHICLEVNTLLQAGENNPFPADPYNCYRETRTKLSASFFSKEKKKKASFLICGNFSAASDDQKRSAKKIQHTKHWTTFFSGLNYFFKNSGLPYSFVNTNF